MGSTTVGEWSALRYNFLGVSGPAGLAQPVVTRLHAAMTEVLADPVAALG